MSSRHRNSFKNQGGDQNTAQGQNPIGQQVNVTQHVDGIGNIMSGTGDVRIEHLEQHLHAASSPPPPHLLPAPNAIFLHRDEELGRLHPGKVVAVCGPGGMGKSALAAQAVHQLEPSRFPDGVVVNCE